ncbi:MAG TPA: DUF4262 domain-containing protein [Microbacterium sp.]|nr:DUF4262 domain-containing protein [Microbacterium sp.]
MSLASDPSVQAWLDQEDRHTADTIRRHGVYIQYVGGGRCSCCEAGVGGRSEVPPSQQEETSFAYTVGLFGIGHPELLVFGIDERTASSLLNHLARVVRGGRDLLPGELLEFDAWTHRVVVEDVPNPGEIVFAANRFYQRPSAASVPVFQLTYDDPRGRFPWDEGYANAGWIQPRPGAFRA